jgi:hypothetical protein
MIEQAVQNLSLEKYCRFYVSRVQLDVLFLFFQTISFSKANLFFGSMQVIIPRYAGPLMTYYPLVPTGNPYFLGLSGTLSRC